MLLRLDVEILATVDEMCGRRVAKVAWQQASSPFKAAREKFIAAITISYRRSV
jgi:hypothetical protein